MVIAVVGGYGVGLTMTVPRAPQAGETVSGGRLARGHGGKGSNQAVGIRRLGQESALFTGVGTDDAGDAAIRFWTDEGVNAGAVVRTAEATMTGFILVDPQGENRIAIADGALAALRPEDVAGFDAVIEAADRLVVSLEVPVPVARRAVQAARDADIPVLLNPAPATRDRELVGLADVITPNLGELAELVDAPGSSIDECLARLFGWYGGTAIVTCGGAGAVVADRQRTERVPAVTPDAVIDTTGAGDSFTAALAVALTEGASAVDAARFAAAAAAFTVGIPEVIPALPRRDDVEQMLTRAREEATAR
jgi:ribokinase